MWDVKHRDWNTKKAKISLGLAEFNWWSLGLGFEFHHTSRAITHRYDHFAHLFINFLWLEVWLAVEWGRKEEWDKAVERMRVRNSGAL